MRIILSVIVLFLILPFSSSSQDSNALGSFSGRTAKKVLKKARKELDYGNLTAANNYYFQLLKTDSANATYNYELALALFNSFQQPKSASYFEKAIKYSKDTIGEAYFFLASAYHLSGEFDLAQKNYKIYFSILSNHGTPLLAEEEKELKMDVLHRIEMCENGKHLYQTPVDKIDLNGKLRPFEISDAGNAINSWYDDYAAVLSNNDSVMYYTSRREGVTGGKLDWDDKYFEDIYVSRLSNQGWSTGIPIENSINTDKHEAIIGVSGDGKTIYFYKGVKQGTFYHSNKIGDSWEVPKPLADKSDINTPSWETSFFGFFSTAKELYVITDRKGGLGGRDIFVAGKRSDGSWDTLRTLGVPINTQYDEDAVYLTSDGATMYFSSTGHNSMGGFDIFKSEKQNGKWSQPVNIGVPFNTPGDDIFFTVADKRDRAYYSSSAQATDSTRDMDIYVIDICDEHATVVIDGLARGITSGTLLVAEKESGKEVGKFEIENSRYKIDVEPGKNYVFTVKTSGIEPASTEAFVPKKCKQYEMYQEIEFTQAGDPLTFKNAFFDIKKQAGTADYSEFLTKADKSSLKDYSETSIVTKPVIMLVSVDTVQTVSGKDTSTAIKTIISFNNFLFDFNKSKLRKEFLPELDKAVAILKNDHPDVKFEIAGHTDSKGNDSYNMNLSKRRANEVLRYFVSKGISRKRMNVVGYGETKPIAANEKEDGSDNPEGRAKNRRTEIVIVK